MRAKQASILAAGVLFALPLRAEDAVSFDRDIVPLLKARCAACHLSGDEPGNMALHPRAAYESLVDVPSVGSALPRVKPGAPDDSYLMHKLTGTHLQVGGTGSPMPLDSEPLDEAEIEMIRAWIAAGAAND